ncbi:MAG: signal peptidase I [Spirochaetales bacterium]|nr:signal peptidase I [Spirochaetia bacterium]MDD7014421.1 signal peptidase I [Spirochaetales bacterium]
MRQRAFDYSYEMQQERQKKITRRLSIVISVILFLCLFLNFIIFPVLVKSDSMEDGIPENALLFVTPIAASPKRGDVVYLSRMDHVELPLYKRFANTLVRFFTLQKYEPFGSSGNISSSESVRRVAALPGDTIYMKDYMLYVKPSGESHFLSEFEMADKPYEVHTYSVPVEWDGLGLASDVKEMTLGEDEYFVLADNRVEACDSRVYGAVKSSLIKGKVLFEVFPFNKMRVF